MYYIYMAMHIQVDNVCPYVRVQIYVKFIIPKKERRYFSLVYNMLSQKRTHKHIKIQTNPNTYCNILLIKFINNFENRTKITNKVLNKTYRIPPHCIFC